MHLTVSTDDDVPAPLVVAVREMVVDAFDGDFATEDWDHTCGGWRIVALVDGEPVAHAAVIARDIAVDGRSLHTGYIEGVATRADRQGSGVGSAVMSAANDVVRERFEFGALSTDRSSFYGRLGWERWNGPTFVRRGTDLERTADEDDGIMVLRHGPSATVDLSAPIVCEERPGDDW